MAKEKLTDGRRIRLADALALEEGRRRAERTFTYQHVETAILRSHNWTEVARKALGARLRNYANLGLGPRAKPGKGARVAYTGEDLLKWVAALELQVLGMAPAESVEFILADWPQFMAAGFPQSRFELAAQLLAGTITQDVHDKGLTRKIQVVRAYTEYFWDAAILRFGLLNMDADEDGNIGNLPAGSNYLLVFDLRRRFQHALSWAISLHEEDQVISRVVEKHPDRVAAALRKSRRVPKP